MGNDGGANTVRSQGRIQGTAKRPERNVCAVEGVEPGVVCAPGVETLCWQTSMLLSFSCGIQNAGQGPGVN